MEGYLWLYIWALAALPWWWRIKQHSCLFPEWCSAVLPNTTASLNLNVRSSSADAQDKANQHHMPRGWTLLPGPGVSHPHRPINQLQTAQFNPNHNSPCTDLLTLSHSRLYTLSPTVVMYRAGRATVKEHLSDCSPHYACFCVILREKR